jgi:hypothetical protein
MTEIKFSKRLSIGLFCIGTLILIVFAATLSVTVAFVGYVFTALSFFLGSVYFLILIINIARGKTDQNIGVKSIGIMLINIPIAAFYLYLVMILINTARITFENTTGHDLSSIKISGCTNKEINFLEAGESETIWINIPSDCSLEINYEIGGQIKIEVVASYLTTSNGVIATYKVGSNQEIFL